LPAEAEKICDDKKVQLSGVTTGHQRSPAVISDKQQQFIDHVLLVSLYCNNTCLSVITALYCTTTLLRKIESSKLPPNFYNLFYNEISQNFKYGM